LPCDLRSGAVKALPNSVSSIEEEAGHGDAVRLGFDQQIFTQPIFTDLS
jgi:hypothetical protein